MWSFVKRLSQGPRRDAAGQRQAPPARGQEALLPLFTDVGYDSEEAMEEAATKLHREIIKASNSRGFFSTAAGYTIDTTPGLFVEQEQHAYDISWLDNWEWDHNARTYEFTVGQIPSDMTANDARNVEYWKGSPSPLASAVSDGAVEWSAEKLTGRFEQRTETGGESAQVAPQNVAAIKGEEDNSSGFEAEDTPPSSDASSYQASSAVNNSTATTAYDLEIAAQHSSKTTGDDDESDPDNEAFDLDSAPKNKLGDSPTSLIYQGKWPRYTGEMVRLNLLYGRFGY